jgi:hypothetical protein
MMGMRKTTVQVALKATLPGDAKEPHAREPLAVSTGAVEASAKDDPLIGRERIALHQFELCQTGSDGTYGWCDGPDGFFE